MPLLHERFPELRETIGHVELGRTPTPVREMPALGLWLKDEGAFGSGAWGGNKVRKLEWIIPEARRRGARTLVTVGGIGTHWGLAAALYGREHGLDVVLALVDQPVDDHVLEQLAHLERSGATIHRTHTKARTIATVPWLLVRHRPAYFLPAGGSSPVGALGYVEAALEIAEQVSAGTLPEPSYVVTAVGSGGTASGLVLGFAIAGLRTRVLAVVVNDKLRLDQPALLKLADGSRRLLVERGARIDVRADPQSLVITRDWLGAGYGHSTPAGEEALRAGEREGLVLEPVYTAKALAAALDERRPGGPVLYLGTHGPR